MKPNPSNHQVWHVIQCMLPIRMKSKSAAGVSRKIKDFLLTHEAKPDVVVRSKQLTGRGLHTWVGMLGYCMKVSILRTTNIHPCLANSQIINYQKYVNLPYVCRTWAYLTFRWCDTMSVMLNLQLGRRNTR